MNDVQVKALVATLQQQRNNALDAVAQSEARNAVLAARIEELNALLTPHTKEPRTG